MSIGHETRAITAHHILHRAQGALTGWMARPGVRATLAATLGLRVFCSLLATLIPITVPDLYPWLSPFQADHFHLAHYPLNALRPVYGPLDYLVRPWERWDTLWFTDIAQHGYATYGSSFFMPLYPLLVRITAPLVGGVYVGAALVVSTIATFWALLALYQLAERLAPGRGLGPYALVVAVLLPTSFFLVAGYTEALFLALAGWAILAALDQRWGRLMVLGGLAALTRQQGVLLGALAVPGVWAWLTGHLRAMRATSAPRTPLASGWGPLLAASAPAAAYGGWMLVLRFVLHAPLPWQLLNTSQAWNLHLTWPGSGVLADLLLLVHPTAGQLTLVGGAALDAATSLGAVGVLVLALRRLPAGLALYLAAMWGSALIKVLPNGLTTGEGRYMLGLLPLCVVPAGWLARGGPRLRLMWIAVGTATLALYLWVFVLWGWVG